MAVVGSASLAIGVGISLPDDSGTRDSAAKVPAAYAPVDLGVQAVLHDREERSAATSTRRTAAPTPYSGRVSRSAVRLPLAAEQRATKSDNLLVTRQSMPGVTRTVEAKSPQDIAMSMLDDYGWSSDQFSCLDSIYTHESNWTYNADNPTSSAYGIPQALPGEKMASAGADWQTNPETQLKWGLGYIRDRYGSPCGAWGFWQSNSWY